MRVTIKAAVLLIVLSGTNVWAQTPHKAKVWSVTWQPVRVVNGAPVLFQIASPVILESLSGTWLGHQVYFSFDTDTKTWIGLGGVSLETPPGQYSLALTGISSKAAQVSFERKLSIGKAKYPSVSVKVAKKFTEPDPEQIKQINQDKTIKEDAFKHFDPDRLWTGDFRPPVKASISDVFGTGRTFNGKVQSRHQGLDYAVAAGTPVAAVNRGTVLLARPLYFEGNCVVIDHGQGLLSLYMHLSEFTVKEGERVSSGQELGLSGGTGRATGPHLHIAVRWQGTYLNPATLMRLRIP